MEAMSGDVRYEVVKKPDEMPIKDGEPTYLEVAEDKMYHRFYELLALGEYEGCRKIIGLMERLSIV